MRQSWEEFCRAWERFLASYGAYLKGEPKPNGFDLHPPPRPFPTKVKR